MDAGSGGLGTSPGGRSTDMLIRRMWALSFVSVVEIAYRLPPASKTSMPYPVLYPEGRTCARSAGL